MEPFKYVSGVLFLCSFSIFSVSGGENAELNDTSYDTESFSEASGYFTDFFPARFPSGNNTLDDTDDEDGTRRHPKQDSSTIFPINDTDYPFVPIVPIDDLEDDDNHDEERDHPDESVFHKASNWFSGMLDKVNRVIGTLPPAHNTSESSEGNPNHTSPTWNTSTNGSENDRLERSFPLEWPNVTTESIFGNDTDLYFAEAVTTEWGNETEVLVEGETNREQRQLDSSSNRSSAEPATESPRSSLLSGLVSSAISPTRASNQTGRPPVTTESNITSERPLPSSSRRPASSSAEPTTDSPRTSFLPGPLRTTTEASNRTDRPSVTTESSSTTVRPLPSSSRRPESSSAEPTTESSRTSFLPGPLRTTTEASNRNDRPPVTPESNRTTVTSLPSSSRRPESSSADPTTESSRTSFLPGPLRSTTEASNRTDRPPVTTESNRSTSGSSLTSSPRPTSSPTTEAETRPATETLSTTTDSNFDEISDLVGTTTEEPVSTSPRNRSPTLSSDPSTNSLVPLPTEAADPNSTAVPETETSSTRTTTNSILFTDSSATLLTTVQPDELTTQSLDLEPTVGGAPPGFLTTVLSSDPNTNGENTTEDEGIRPPVIPTILPSSRAGSYTNTPPYSYPAIVMSKYSGPVEISPDRFQPVDQGSSTDDKQDNSPGGSGYYAGTSVPTMSEYFSPLQVYPPIVRPIVKSKYSGPVEIVPDRLQPENQDSSTAEKQYNRPEGSEYYTGTSVATISKFNGPLQVYPPIVINETENAVIINYPYLVDTQSYSSVKGKHGKPNEPKTGGPYPLHPAVIAELVEVDKVVGNLINKFPEFNNEKFGAVQVKPHQKYRPQRYDCPVSDKSCTKDPSKDDCVADYDCKDPLQMCCEVKCRKTCIYGDRKLLLDLLRK